MESKGGQRSRTRQEQRGWGPVRTLWCAPSQQSVNVPQGGTLGCISNCGFASRPPGFSLQWSLLESQELARLGCPSLKIPTLQTDNWTYLPLKRHALLVQVPRPADPAPLPSRVWPLCSCGKRCLEPPFSSPLQLSPAMARSNLTACFCVADSPLPAFAPTAQRTPRGNTLPGFWQSFPTNPQKHHFFQVHQPRGSKAAFNSLLLLYHPPTSPNKAVSRWEGK